MVRASDILSPCFCYTVHASRLNNVQIRRYYITYVVRTACCLPLPLSSFLIFSFLSVLYASFYVYGEQCKMKFEKYEQDKMEQNTKVEPTDRIRTSEVGKRNLRLFWLGSKCTMRPLYATALLTSDPLF